VVAYQDRNVSREQAFERLKKWDGSRWMTGAEPDMLAKFDLGTRGAKASEPGLSRLPKK
jgi:hypothetical protein